MSSSLIVSGLELNVTWETIKSDIFILTDQLDSQIKIIK